MCIPFQYCGMRSPALYALGDALEQTASITQLRMRGRLGAIRW
jgi:hypothetical protein